MEKRLEAGKTVDCPCGSDARVLATPPEAPMMADCPWGHLLRERNGAWVIEGSVQLACAGAPS